MSKPINKLDAHVLTIRVLALVVLGLLVFLGYAVDRIVNIPKEYTFWTPPDLTKGSFARLNKPDDIHLVNFAASIHAGIYRWKKNGQQEFEDNVDVRRHYLSKAYFSILKSRAQSKGTIYRNRVRDLEFDIDNPKHRIVEDLGNNRFNIKLTIRIIDSVSDNEIKDEFIQYSYHVALVPTLRKNNPFGLKIMGEFSPSKRVKG